MSDPYFECLSSGNHAARGVGYFLSQPHGSRRRATVLSLLYPGRWHSEARDHVARHAYVLRTESLAADIAGLWEWLCVPPGARAKLANVNKNQDPVAPVDAAGMALLATWLRAEQDTMNALENFADNGRGRAALAALGPVSRTLPHHELPEPSAFPWRTSPPPPSASAAVGAHTRALIEPVIV